MAEILGLGCTHWPTLCLPNERLTDVFNRVLDAPNVDPSRKHPVNWPAELLAELGNDNGLSAAQRCGERFGKDIRAIRKILDDFNPDFVLVWVDDQYENFKEDIVPLVRLNNGLELYRFRYKGSDRTAYVGVMAQEVQQIEPSAVWRDHDGYLMVNYDRIGVKFMTWKEWLAQSGSSSSLP